MVDDVDPRDALLRYAPDVGLPPYTYVPGLAPHPLSDPAGHSYGHQPSVVDAIDDTSWRRSIPYLHAIDLFNRGYYWEAHEVWESLWHACGRRGELADLLKGFIKLAAAGVKVREGRPTGVATHARRAAELFRAASSQGVSERLGLPLDKLAALADDIALSPPQAAPSERQAAVSCTARPVFAFRLTPRIDATSE